MPSASPFTEILRLVVAPEQEVAPIVVKLIDDVNQKLSAENRVQVIELIIDLLIRKFPHLSREEIKAMFMLANNDVKKTKFYQEVYHEGKSEGRAEGKSEGRAEGKSEGRAEGKQEVAIKLLRLGMNPDQIAIVTELSVDYIRSLNTQ